MRCTILLHSSTGNTRLLARLALSLLQDRGHACALHDIVREPTAPDLEQTELLVVACPTMYFRPTLAMERFVDRLAAPSGSPRPALLLGTASGEPGAHFELLTRQLRPKGWIVLGAHWAMMPTNWPPHRRVASPFAVAGPLAARVARAAPASRLLLALTWPDLGVPGEGGPRRLERFLDAMLSRATDLSSAPEPEALHRGLPGLAALGRRMRPEMMRKATDPRIDATRCSACGTCVEVCPVECITRADEDAVPTVGQGCTGCWSCYNHCPEGAIDGWWSPGGRYRYGAPPPELRRLFRPRGEG